MFTNAYTKPRDHGLGVCRFWYKTSDLRPVYVGFMHPRPRITVINTGFMRETELSRKKSGKEMWRTAFFTKASYEARCRGAVIGVGLSPLSPSWSSRSSLRGSGFEV
jgi:hypothetical protein